MKVLAKILAKKLCKLLEDPSSVEDQCMLGR